MPSLLLVGTGLIGGSFALAAKAAGLFDRVVGADRDPAALREALRLGVIDAIDDGEDGFAAACIAVPVTSIAAQVREAAARARVVFDVGSVKGAVMAALRPMPPNYVPCHPIAGSEQGGAGAARADLFKDRLVVLTPSAEMDAKAAVIVKDYWRRVGGQLAIESAADHDRRFALLSHLPHLVAFAFMEVVANAGSPAGGGGGFRDFTRIAAADADVWADILHANAPHWQSYLDELATSLRGIAAAAQSGGEGLRQRLAAAAQAKRDIDAKAPGSLAGESTSPMSPNGPQFAATPSEDPA